MKKRNMHLEYFIQTIIYITFIIIQIADCSFICPLSTPTIKYVTSCPHNKTGWEKAVQRKNCESMAPHQNCTEPKNFQYHCLINHLRNATLEVCAPIYYLQGYCAYYNTNNKEIMENYDQGFECLKFPAPEQCPSRYPSSEAYKYLRCYAPKNPQPTTPLPAASSTNEIKFRSDVVYIVFVTILSVALVAVSLLFIWWERKSLINLCHKGCKSKDSNNPEKNSPEETDLLASKNKEINADMKDNEEATNKCVTNTENEQDVSVACKNEEVTVLVVTDTNEKTNKKPPPRPEHLPSKLKPKNPAGKTSQPSNYKSGSAIYTGKKTNQSDLKKQSRSK